MDYFDNSWELKQFQNYAREAEVTMNKDLNASEQLTMCVIGLVAELAELVDEDKKVIYHKHPRNLDKVVKELGDVCWYLAGIYNVIGRFASLSEPVALTLASAADSYPMSMQMLLNIALLSRHINSQYIVIPQNFTSYVFDSIFGLCNHYGVELKFVLDTNIMKLRTRYPEGFSSKDSIARVDTQL